MEERGPYRVRRDAVLRPLSEALARMAYTLHPRLHQVAQAHFEAHRNNPRVRGIEVFYLAEDDHMLRPSTSRAAEQKEAEHGRIVAHYWVGLSISAQFQQDRHVILFQGTTQKSAHLALERDVELRGERFSKPGDQCTPLQCYGAYWRTALRDTVNAQSKIRLGFCHPPCQQDTGGQNQPICAPTKIRKKSPTLCILAWRAPIGSKWHTPLSLRYQDANPPPYLVSAVTLSGLVFVRFSRKYQNPIAHMAPKAHRPPTRHLPARCPPTATRHAPPPAACPPHAPPTVS